MESTVASQTADLLSTRGSLQQSEQDIRTKFVGDYLTIDVFIDGVLTTCLVDTGSQVTTVTQEFLTDRLTARDIQKHPLNWLKLKAANGLEVPFVGGVELKMKIAGVNLDVCALIVSNEPIKGVPCLLGMNVISQCQDVLFQLCSPRVLNYLTPTVKETSIFFQTTSMDLEGSPALQTDSAGKLGKVTVRGNGPITIKGREEVLIDACCNELKSIARPIQALMEPMPPEQYNLPHNILVARTLVVVNNNRVTARVINVGDHDITLPKGAPLGDLFQVEVLPVAREVDMEQTGPHTLRVGIHQQHASTYIGTVDRSDQLLADVDVNTTDLTAHQKQQLKHFLHSHQQVFSQHEMIRLHRYDNAYHPTNNEPPSRERYRMIPPKLYKEVKEQLQVMLDKGVITESFSPWAAPIVLVKKKDGTIRFCVDYRKLNDKTRKDAFPLPRIEESLNALSKAKLFSTQI
ncbi:hypothetical protein BSL78_08517 [Apostichopus japonicus]|uniref:Peptidase A2 domain-containing protein n=1 Tax=Stichopus japonicus TaxID=307972 RepID=A0A2G8L2U4_STIJA|nr:hypothetical protein BSL78_08517 [Apostichopus japonicus]